VAGRSVAVVLATGASGCGELKWCNSGPCSGHWKHAFGPLGGTKFMQSSIFNTTCRRMHKMKGGLTSVLYCQLLSSAASGLFFGESSVNSVYTTPTLYFSSI